MNRIQGLQETWRYCLNSICVACQVQDVFFHRGCQFVFSGVDVGDDGAPGFGLGYGEVDGVAFSHVPGKHQCSEHGEVVKSVFDV